ncbi:hypothetical protein ACW9HQ_53105, partial [Nocardia gipuzkoensis]
MATNPVVAEWCRKPIDFGHPELVLRPLVLGPDSIPAVTDPAEAIAAPERAVLSAIAHGNEPNADAVLSALMAGLSNTDYELGNTYEYRSDFARRYVAEGRAAGRAEGEAAALLMVLQA